MVLCEPPDVQQLLRQIFNTDEGLAGGQRCDEASAEYTERSCYVSLEDPECGCHGEYAWWISQNDVDDCPFKQGPGCDVGSTTMRPVGS